MTLSALARDDEPRYHSPEVRAVPAKLRADGASRTIHGLAAPFGVLSNDLGGYREQISREAFRETLREGDCRALWAHDSRLVLGRVSAGTLRLRESNDGLAFECDLPSTTYANDVLALIRRGDLDAMSFGFRIKRDDWTTTGDGTPLRVLKQVELLDVSPVTWPAYTNTVVATRSVVIPHNFREPQDESAPARRLSESELRAKRVAALRKELARVAQERALNTDRPGRISALTQRERQLQAWLAECQPPRDVWAAWRATWPREAMSWTFRG